MLDKALIRFQSLDGKKKAPGWLRFLMMIIFSVNTLCNAMVWITFGSVPDQFKSLYHADDMTLNMLATTYSIAFVPLALVGANVIARYGIRRGFLFGCFLNMLGAAIRILPSPFMKSEGTVGLVCVFIGQSICSIAQPFIVSGPATVAQQWFPPAERVTATSFMTMSNQAGIAVSYFLSPFMLQSSDANMTKLLAVETGMCSVGFLLTLLFFEGHCKSIEVEASEGVETEAESGLFGWAELRDQLGDVLRNRDLILLVCVFGAEIGVFYSISTVIGQIAENANYTSSQGGTLGVLLVAVGLIGAILSGMIADKLGNKHWYLIQTFGVLQFLSLLWFALRLAPGRYEEMIICCCVLGFVQTPLLGLTVDLAVEVGYPVPEIVVATVLFLSPIVISVPLVLGPGSYLPGSVFIYMCMGLVLVSVLAMFTFRGNYNRRMAESSSGAATDPSSERLLPRA